MASPSNQPPVNRRIKGWERLKKELSNRINLPRGNPLFVIYFLSIVVVVAGLGIIISIVRHLVRSFPTDDASLASCQGIFENAGTYSIAISATALADIIVAKQDNEIRVFKTFAIALTVFVGLGFAAAFSMPFGWALAGSIFGVVVALFQWWIINAHNANLEDDDPTEYTGGNPEGDLSGSLNGFKT